MEMTWLGVLVVLAALANAILLGAVAARNTRRWQPEAHEGYMDRHVPHSS